jgi:hypothetical protein
MKALHFYGIIERFEPKVRNTALKTSVKKYNTEVINAIIENLGNPVFSNQAMNALFLSELTRLPH